MSHAAPHAAPSPLSRLPRLGRCRVTASVRTTARLVALPALLLASALPAQVPGDVVRVRGESTAPWRTGRLVARADSTLVLRVDREYVRDTTAGGAGGRWMPAGNDTIPLAAVRQLEVRRHEANRGRRAALGGIGGGVLGALLGGLLGSQAGGDAEVNFLPVIGAGVGGLAGLVFGGLAGARSATPTAWESVPLPAATPR